MKTLSVFSISSFPSSRERALIEKRMFVQLRSFYTSKLSSGTALQKDFVIRQVELKHLMMNTLAAIHSA